MNIVDNPNREEADHDENENGVHVGIDGEEGHHDYEDEHHHGGRGQESSQVSNVSLGEHRVGRQSQEHSQGAHRSLHHRLLLVESRACSHQVSVEHRVDGQRDVVQRILSESLVLANDCTHGPDHHENGEVVESDHAQHHLL